MCNVKRGFFDFQVCHPHISTLDQLNQKSRYVRSIRDLIWCQICQKKHADLKLDAKIRKKLVMGSSTLAHLWKSNGYKENCDFHVDFDCIIGGQIHDVHLSFERQYKDLANPMDIILACGMNNVPTNDEATTIILQLKSFLQTIENHSERHGHKHPNR